MVCFFPVSWAGAALCKSDEEQKTEHKGVCTVKPT